MSELNYLRIAQLLGGRLTEIGAPSFGSFGAAQTSVERFRLLHVHDEEPAIPENDFKKIVDAFERVRDGYEVDRVLVDPVLSRELISECRARGVSASTVAINKKLQAFRKASGAYHIKLKKTTRAAGLDPEPWFLPSEMGYTQLNYRKQVSVDDILTNPSVGDEFVSLCKGFAPRGRGIDFKWAAVRLRKMRAFDKKITTRLLKLEPEKIEHELKDVGTLADLSVDDIPNTPGIFSFSERNGTSHYLYVGSGSEGIRKAILPIRDANPFIKMSGQFWRPSPKDIFLSIAELPKRWHNVSIRDVGLRLIETRHPLFNMPVHLKAA